MGASTPRTSNPGPAPDVQGGKEAQAMQQLPPFPDDNPEPSTPGQPTPPGRPSEAPNENPPTTPDIDVPSPSQPATDPSPTPISPVGGGAVA